MYDDEEESIYDEWGYHRTVNVAVDFLLPTGIYIPMDVPRNAAIKEVKVKLWNEAIHHPLFNKLVNPESYTFAYITNHGALEEIVDEDKHLSEFDLIHELPVLKLVQSQGNIEEKRVFQEVHHLAGITSEKELNADSECISFRKEMRDLATKVSIDRNGLHWKALLEHHYAPSIVPYLNEQTHYLKDYGLIQLKLENTETTYTIKVNPNWKANDLTSEAVHTWDVKPKFRLPSTNPDDYVLKASGKQFIVGDHKIYTFKCLRESLVGKREAYVQSAKAPPVLTLMHVGIVRQLLPETTNHPAHLQGDFPPPVPEKRRQVRSLWKMDSQFSVVVNRAGSVNMVQEKDKKMIVHIGLYHGLEPLCATSYTKEHSKDGPGNEFIWEDECFFEIQLCDLPKNAKLCITICTINNRKKKGKQETNRKWFLANSSPVAWVNMTVFDFKGNLKTGVQRLNCWPWPENLDSNNLKPSGYVITNPNEENAPFIEVDMREYSYSAMIQYPSHADVLAEAARQASTQNVGMLSHPAKSHLVQLAEIVKKDRFDDLFEHERKLLWFLRFDCRDQYHEDLPKIINAVNWNSHKDVSQFEALLDTWPQLRPERAMELLDVQYADQRVRDFAVNCLRELRDDDLQHYLMQLVQALKFESYIDSSLVRFILERSWRNRKIGHYFFWHLKAEVSEESKNMRFSLFLEAYLYGNLPHMKVLYKQFEALNKMKTLNLRVKDSKIRGNEVKTRAREALQDTASQTTFSEALSEVESPLEPNVELKELIVKESKVMNSKMRPLWLEFKNHEVPDGKIVVIYKNGDDLRQDMLTLQIISIMDTLWKSEGLDLRMIPYGCLATGKDCGMIEVVRHSNTIANIQKTRGGKMSAFRHQTLLEWIEQNNKQSKHSLDQAIENFTYSCAGYCVATYVLGVGDRHSDNIMITEKGQLFHIDFGHILGNFKSKYGIKRERVPFVLAHDFVHVINKGKTNEKKDFEVFRKLCDNAFCILRKKGYLFITLFALMLHSGLPELTSLDHLEYLRETLSLHLSEEKALQQFRSKFNKALADAWSTSVNWFFHNVHVN